ncbi:MAG: hypothetical protein EG828_16445, partial [Deltaproteobacteria bacterium]|nr:hypothetical protein [Deltaproteobacteria bacterium]
MTSFLISLILGLWLLIVIAFYTLIVGAAVCRILAGLRQSFDALACVRGLRLLFPTGRRRLRFPSHPLKMTAALALACILTLPPANFVWPASSLISYCGLILIFIV